MAPVAQVAKLLGRYSDLLQVVSVLPFISHVKFAGVVSDPKTDRKADAGYLPPAWSLLLVFVAEVLSATWLFDAKDQTVRRALGLALRQQKRSEGASMQTVLHAVDQVLNDDDVYRVLVALGCICGSGCLLLASLAGLDRLPSKDSGKAASPIAAAFTGLKTFLKSVLQPRLIFFALLAAATCMGNYSTLKKIPSKPGMQELFFALPALLRALAMTGAAFSPWSGVLPTYAAINVCAALARETHTLVYERITFPELLEDGLFSSKNIGPRTVVAMEAWIMLMMVPIAFSKQRFVLLLPLMALPCGWLASETPLPAIVETNMELITSRLVFSSALVALLTCFMGGAPAMSILIGLMQLLTRVHKLETVK